MYVFKEYKNQKTLFTSLSELIVDELLFALRNKRIVTLAVPGGTTPTPLFHALSLAKIEWNRVVVIPTDERCVTGESHLSNSRLIRNNLLINRAKKASFSEFFIPDISPNEMAAAGSKKLKDILPIDVCVLGMGTDMHTASIFPDADRLSDALSSESSDILIPISSPTVAEMRLTLSATVLKSACRLHLIFTGLDKKAAFLESLNKKSYLEAPVKAIIDREGETLVHYSN